MKYCTIFYIFIFLLLALFAQAQDIEKEVITNQKETNWFYHLAVGLSGGVGRTDELDYGFNIENTIGYQYKRWLGFGANLGVHTYVDDEVVVFPVSAHIRSYILKHRRSPYIGMNVGYGFAKMADTHLYNEAKGGLILNPVIGVRFGSKIGALLVDFGVKIQEVTLTREGYSWFGKEMIRDEVKYLRSTIRLGWLF